MIALSARAPGTQTWEEKERLSRMYEEERKKNMESVDRIRNVMEVRTRCCDRGKGRRM